MSDYWAMVPEKMIRSELSDRAVRVYALLLRYANADRIAWPRQTVMAKELGCSRATVERAVRELREKGWVKTERRESGGVCEYLLRTSPAPPERRMSGGVEITDELVERLAAEAEAGYDIEPCEPPLTDEGALPSPVRGHIEPEPENQRLPAATPPRAAVRGRQAEARETARREAALDPEVALGIWDKPRAIRGATPTCVWYDEIDAGASLAPRRLAPRRRSVDGDSPMGLALAWRETMRDAGITGALDANVKALAAHFKAMLDERVTPSQIRAITRLYAAKPGLRNSSASPWRDFLSRRHLLLASVQDTDRYEAAKADPGSAYGLRSEPGGDAGARYSEDLARFMARR